MRNKLWGRGTGERDLKEKGRERRDAESVVGEHHRDCTKPEDMFAFVGRLLPEVGGGDRAGEAVLWEYINE